MCLEHYHTAQAIQGPIWTVPASRYWPGFGQISLLWFSWWLGRGGGAAVMDTRQCSRVLHVLYGTRLVTVHCTECRTKGYTRMIKAEQQERGGYIKMKTTQKPWWGATQEWWKQSNKNLGLLKNDSNTATRKRGYTRMMTAREWKKHSNKKDGLPNTNMDTTCNTLNKIVWYEVTESICHNFRQWKCSHKTCQMNN